MVKLESPQRVAAMGDAYLADLAFVLQFLLSGMRPSLGNSTPSLQLRRMVQALGVSHTHTRWHRPITPGDIPLVVCRSPQPTPCIKEQQNSTRPWHEHTNESLHAPQQCQVYGIQERGGACPFADPASDARRGWPTWGPNDEQWARK
jgi:hypothetical protein